jgi:hypothetical protein
VLLYPFSTELIHIQIFLHQGSGDVDLSGDLTKAACNTCIDLDLQTKVLSGNASEEELFCFLWCYTLDRNHAFKSRTSRCLLDVQLPPTFSDLYPTDPPMAEHFLIYLDLARVQDTVVSYLPDSSSSHHNPSLLHGTGEYMLLQMQYIEQRMNHVSQEHLFSFTHRFLTDEDGFIVFRMERARLSDRNVGAEVRLSIHHDRNPIPPPIRSRPTNQLNRKLPSIGAPGALSARIHVSLGREANRGQLFELVRTHHR